MAKNNNDENANESGSEIERHIDEMMDPKLPDPTPSKKTPGAPDLPEIDIFKDKKPLEDINTEQKSDTDKEEVKEETPAEEAPIDEKASDSVELDDNKNDAIVDDIVAHEGDELLAVQDANADKAPAPEQMSFADRMRQFFARWWDNKLARYSSLVAIVVLIGVAGTIPTSRYAVLNTVGVRSSTSLTILDNTTDLPLKNVNVVVGNVTGKTNVDGVVRLQGLKLGTQEIIVTHLGFATLHKTVVLGLGSNPLGEFNLTAVGVQFKFVVTDYLSGKPVASAEASAGDANAQADDKGQIILTVGGANPAPQFSVLLNAAGYRQEKVSVDAANKNPTNVIMVTTKKEVFVSKQSGKYDVYRIDVDGKNKQVLMAGTGLERPQISLVSHPTDNLVALVSSRDNKHNQDGYLLDTLTVINVDNGSTLQLDQSEQIKIVDWIQDKLIYVKVKAGTSAGNAERYQLMSYDYSSTKRVQLASANNFADIVSAKGALYYATANYYQPGQSQFVKINPDNTGRQVLLNAQAWSILRSSYGDLSLAGDYTGSTQNWYSYHLGDAAAKKLSSAPADTNTDRLYLESPDGKRALWTEPRDGKGTLLMYDDTTKRDAVLAAQSGITYPFRWLDNRTVIFRVVTQQETADYVQSIDTSSPHKITDVTNTTGLSPWQYGY
jgi:hypothetical protein